MPPYLPSTNTSGAMVVEPKYEVRVVPPLDLVEFNKDCLRAHNDYRSVHSAPCLKLDKKLRLYAQEWADTLARLDTVQHRPANPFGENVYACEGFEPTGFRTVQRWYQQHKDFDLDRPTLAATTGHFTQLVWRKTRRLGVGVARSDCGSNGSGGQYYVVANYDPPGNVVGEYRENVRPRVRNKQPRELHTFSWSEFWARLVHPFSRFQQQCVAEHNRLRRLHGAQPLRLQRRMCDEAQIWAQRMAVENRMRSQGWVRYGENIFSMRWSAVRTAHGHGMAEMPGGKPVLAWYAEGEGYRGEYTAETGHFTQIVWQSSVELGVGVARSRTGDVYVVAMYYPPGNIQGEFGQNVRGLAQLEERGVE